MIKMIGLLPQCIYEGEMPPTELGLLSLLYCSVDLLYSN